MKSFKYALTGGAIFSLLLMGGALLWQGSVDAKPGASSGPAPLTAAEEENLSHANSLSQAFRTATNRVMPAVVTIRTDVRQEQVQLGGGQGQQVPDQLKNDPFFKRFMERMPEGHAQQQSPPSVRQGMGSGVIIDPTGLILTNNHVVQNGEKVVVRLHDGREFEASKVTSDPKTDLAIVQIDNAGDLPYATLGDSEMMEIGDWVIAVGAPFRLQESVTAGIISGKSRVIGINDREEYLQTDAAINPGNSGGPLVNLAGDIVGINTAISSTSGGYQGIGFAIPVNLAKWVVEQLRDHGEVRRAYLGVLIRDVNSQLAAQIGLDEVRGAFVSELQKDGPADQAGVQVGDVILEFASRKVMQPSDLQKSVERSSLNSKQKLVVFREGKKLDLNVEVKALPSELTASDFQQSDEQTVSLDSLGIGIRNLDEATAEKLSLKSTVGVLVQEVKAGSVAEKAGIEPGVAIIKIGRDDVENVEGLKKSLAGLSLSEGVVLTVRNQEGSRIIYLGSR